MTKTIWCWLLLLTLGSIARGAGLQPMDFAVDGVARSALIYLPPQARTASTPVIFVFHGHGGSADQAAHSFHMDREWPEAISVYMQGIRSPGMVSDPQGKRTGWQNSPGAQGDRDLKFFDTVLARLEKDYKVDTSRIYCTGQSNGGGFTYLLWLTRPGVFAAVAPSSAAAAYGRKLTPKPAMILGGRNDHIVKFAWQEMMMEGVRQINGCSPAGVPWNQVATLYSSRSGTPLVTYVFEGGHQFGPPEPRLIATFFKEHPAAAK